MANDKARKVYDYLSSNGAQNIGGSADEFMEIMKDSGKRTKVFNYLRENGAQNIGDNADDLFGIMGGSLETRKSAQPRVTTPQTQQGTVRIGDKTYLNDPRSYRAIQEAKAQEEQRAQAQDRLEGMTEEQKQLVKDSARQARIDRLKDVLGAMAQGSTMPGAMTPEDTSRRVAEMQNNKEAADKLATDRLLATNLGQAADQLKQVENPGWGLARGFAQGARNIQSWDMGLSELANIVETRNLAKKAETGKLEEADFEVLDKLALAQEVIGVTSPLVGNAYQVGKGLPQSLAFMGTMIANPAAGIGKAMSERVAHKYGTKLLREGVEKELVRKSKNLAIRKAATRVGGDMAEMAVMTATWNQAGIAADMLERMTPGIDYDITPEGMVYFKQFDSDNVESGTSAFLHSLASHYIENWSEAMGEYLPLDALTDIFKAAHKGTLGRSSLDALSRDVASNGTEWARALAMARKNMHLSGTIGEVLEEEIGLALNTLAGTDQQWHGDVSQLKQNMKDAFLNKDQQLQIIATCSLLTGGAKAVEVGTNLANERGFNKTFRALDERGSKIFGADEWAQRKQELDALNADQLADYLRQTFNDEQLTTDQRATIAGYVSNLIQYQQYNLMTEMSVDPHLKHEFVKAKRDLASAFNEGYLMPTSGVRQFRRRFDESRQAVADMGTPVEITDQLLAAADEGKPYTEVEAEIQQFINGLDAQQQQTLRDYYHNIITYNALQSRMADDAEIYANEMEHDLAPVVTLDADGRAMVTTAVYTDGTGKQSNVYVVDKGAETSMVIDADGNMSQVKSDMLSDHITFSKQMLIDAYTNRYMQDKESEQNWAAQHNQQTRMPEKGMTLYLGQDPYVVVDSSPENGYVNIVEGVYDQETNMLRPKDGAQARTLSITGALQAQDIYYDNIDAQQSEQGEQTEQSEQPQQTEQPAPAVQPEQGEQPKQPEQSEQPEQVMTPMADLDDADLAATAADLEGQRAELQSVIDETKATAEAGVSAFNQEGMAKKQQAKKDLAVYQQLMDELNARIQEVQAETANRTQLAATQAQQRQQQAEMQAQQQKVMDSVRRIEEYRASLEGNSVEELQDKLNRMNISWHLRTPEQQAEGLGKLNALVQKMADVTGNSDVTAYENIDAMLADPELPREVAQSVISQIMMAQAQGHTLSISAFEAGGRRYVITENVAIRRGVVKTGSGANNTTENHVNRTAAENVMMYINHEGVHMDNKADKSLIDAVEQQVLAHDIKLQEIWYVVYSVADDVTTYKDLYERAYNGDGNARRALIDEALAHGAQVISIGRSIGDYSSNEKLNSFITQAYERRIGTTGGQRQEAGVPGNGQQKAGTAVPEAQGRESDNGRVRDNADGDTAARLAASEVKEYTTKDGESLSFVSLLGEPYEGENVSVQRRDSAKDRTGTDNIQRKINSIAGVKLRELEEGEFCNVERSYTENKHYNFTARGNKIQSLDDVAYIFKTLQDSAVEHAFAVLVKNGKPTVIHLGIGGFASSSVDLRVIVPAVNDIQPDTIYMVHNHPSGNLSPSSMDYNMLGKFREAFGGVNIEGIIIDSYKNKYSNFSEIDNMPDGSGREIKQKVYSFDKQAFVSGYIPKKMIASNDVASFIATQRLGVRDKLSALIISNAGEITGNIHLAYPQIGGNEREVAKDVADMVARMGGTAAIVYGNNIDYYNAADLKHQLDKYTVYLLDVINIRHDIKDFPYDYYDSSNDKGLSEPSSEYGDTARFAASEDYGIEKPQPFTEQEQAEWKALNDAEITLRYTERDYDTYRENSISGRQKALDRLRKDIDEEQDEVVKSALQEMYDTVAAKEIPSRKEHAKMLQDAQDTYDRIKPEYDRRHKEWTDYYNAVSEIQRKKLEEERAIAKKTKPVYAEFTEEQKADNDRIAQAAKKQFGTTTNFNEAAYILADGSMLDFSGKRDGGTPGSRSEDHRAIGIVEDKAEDGWSSLINFVHRGNIRIMPESYSLNIGQKPTAAQLKRIGDFVRFSRGEQMDIEFFDDNKKSEHMASYLNAQPQRIVADILRYFDEGIRPDGNMRFASSIDASDPFYSNAAHALEGIKQNKATAEQWIAMLQKAGGLKAEEDKWMGLSDWLKSQKGSIEKSAVEQFIADNAIKVEDVKYEEFDGLEEADPYEFAEYNNEHATNENKSIHPTRFAYTTAGLGNKREIAMTVPTIEPYNESDTVHFGDAGNGRAVAWVRFGDAKSISKEQHEWMRNGRKNGEPHPEHTHDSILVIDEIQSKRHQDGREKGYNFKDTKLKQQLDDILSDYRNAQYLYEQFINSMGDSILFKDRWSEYDKERYEQLKKDYEEANKKREEFLMAHKEFNTAYKNSDLVPDAPFRKNWHELAMKRMLRLAAEEGYDKIAWTNGAMQAERYKISGFVPQIDVYTDPHPVSGSEASVKQISFELNGKTYKPLLNRDGIVLSDCLIGNTQLRGKNISELFGKEIADAIMSTTKQNETIEVDKVVGGDGMKGFYDKMLVDFMNKYGKKWGVKVQDISLQGLQNEDGWHSIDVTPEMRQSVLEGQPMFAVSQDGTSELRGLGLSTSQAYQVKNASEIGMDGGMEVDGRISQPVMFSVTAQATGVGLGILKDNGSGSVAMIHPDGRAFDAKHHITAEDLKGIKDSPFSLVMQYTSKVNKLSEEQKEMIWQRYADMINAVLDKGQPSDGKSGFDNVAGDWQWIADTVYKTVATNGDEQYSYSLDITRVCKKNEAVIKSISEMQRRLGYGITPVQIMDLYNATIDKDLQVPCPVCYVFSRYIRNGKYATIMLNAQRKYREITITLNGKEVKVKGLVDPRTISEEEKKARIAFWEAERKRVKKLNDKYAKQITKAASDITEPGLMGNDMGRLLKEIDEVQVEMTRKGADKKKLMQKALKLDAQYRAALNLVSQSSLDSWIDQFAIHEKKVDGKVQTLLWEDSYHEFSPEMALDLRQTATVLREYPAIQRFRNSRGSPAGKEITFESNNDLGDIIQALGSGAQTKDMAKPAQMTDEEWEELSKSPEGRLMGGVKNMFQQLSQAIKDGDKKKQGDLKKKIARRVSDAHIYAQQQSLRGGQRMWSWSDNIERLAPDVFFNLMQLQMLGGALQSYSKQLEGIKHVATLGGYVNGSLMGKGKGYVEVPQSKLIEKDGRFYTEKDGGEVPVYFNKADGKYYTLDFDKVVGIDAFGEPGADGNHLKGLFDLNAELDKAGNILVGMNDIHVRAAMADPRIFFIIPWHSSGANTHVLQQMYNYLGVQYDTKKDAKDYTDVQEEKRYKVSGAVEEETDETTVDEAGKPKKDETKVPAGVQAFWKSREEAGKQFRCGTEFIESGEEDHLSKGQEHYRELRDAIFLGIRVDKIDKDGKPVIDKKTGKVKTEVKDVKDVRPEWYKEIMDDEFLSQAYRKVHDTVDTGLMTSTDCKYIYPYEYWDEGSTFETADVNGPRYVEYCRRLGFKPKFVGKLNSNVKEDHGNFVDDPGYWKLLIDRRMYDTRNQFQDLTPVDVSNFTPALVDPQETSKEFKVTTVAKDEQIPGIVDDAINAENIRDGGVAMVNYDLELTEAAADYELAQKDPASFDRKNRKMFMTGDAVADLLENYDSRTALRVSAVNSPGMKIAYGLKDENPMGVMFATSQELNDRFGDAWIKDQENEAGGHSTQVANTVSTYRKIGDWMMAMGIDDADVLDASSGLGLGTKALRDMGYSVDDVEPYPSPKREDAATYGSYGDIDKQYDIVISNAVLNVIPDDWRADVLRQMASVVKPGGRIIINTRPASNIAKQGKEGETRVTLDSPSEILVKRKNGTFSAYQKGFTSEELQQWVKDELGKGWTVEKAGKANSGISGEGTAVVIRDANDTPDGDKPRFATSQSTQPDFKNYSGSRIGRDAQYGVGKSVAYNLYVHKDYVPDAFQEYVDKAARALPEDFTYNTVMLDKKAPNMVRFDEAPDFDTANHPHPGDMYLVDANTGKIVPDSRGNEKRHSNMIWHHKWMWVDPEYTGFDTQASYDWSKEFAVKVKANPSGSDRVWQEQLAEAGIEEPRFAATNNYDGKFQGDYIYTGPKAEGKAENEILDYIMMCLNKFNDGKPADCIGYALNMVTDNPEEAKGWTEEIVGKFTPDMFKDKEQVADENKLSGDKFKNWFGDWENSPKTASKVVDENGRPKAVYHGSKEVEHYTFDEDNVGIFFTDSASAADDYAFYDNDYEDQGQFFEVFLDIKKPFEFDAEHSEWKDLPSKINGVNYGGHTINALAKYIKEHPELGYDGVIAHNIIDGYGPSYGSMSMTDYIVFKSTQIKSVDNTEFDPENRDIRYAVSQQQVEEFRQAYKDGDTKKAQQMVRDAFKAKFPNAKVVDENGEPLVVYHTTDDHIVAFDRSRLGKNTMANNIGDEKGGYAQTSLMGFWFNTDKIPMIGSSSIPAFLNIDSIYDGESLKTLAGDIESEGGADIFRSILESDGYNGLWISDEEMGGISYVAFNPNQIFSADPFTFDDNGELIPLSKRFDESNDDIRFAATEEQRKVRGARKEIYTSILENGFDNVTLRLIDDYLTKAEDEGYKISERLPDTWGRGSRKGDEVLGATLLLDRLAEASVTKAEKANALTAKKKADEAAQELLESWAKATGHWYDEGRISDLVETTEDPVSASDSLVYISKDGKNVIKTSHNKPGKKSFAPDRDYVAIFNDVFPQTAYELLGFSRDKDGKFMYITKQPFVVGEQATQEQIKEYMESKGFKQRGRNFDTYYNDDYIISDLKWGNVIVTEEGNIAVIDADCLYNTTATGGKLNVPDISTEIPEGSNPMLAASRAVYVRDEAQDFTQQILDGSKTIETRNSRIPGVKVGDRIAIIRSGKGLQEVVGYATVSDIIKYESEQQWKDDADRHQIKPGTKAYGKYGWKAGKLGYVLTDVEKEETPYEPSKKGRTTLLPSADGRFAVTAEQDADYMDAVKSGDMEKAAKMVKDAFKAKYPDTRIVDENGDPRVMYHGSPWYGFRIFEPGEGKGQPIYFGYDRSFAQEFADKHKGDEDWFEEEGNPLTPGIYDVFLNVKNPVNLGHLSGDDSFDDVMNALGMTEEELSQYHKRKGFEGYELLDFNYAFNDELRARGYDAAIGYEGDDKEHGWQVAVYDPRVIKSAAPVTYDKDGNVIPLSERFDDTNYDINFAASSEPDIRLNLDSRATAETISNEVNRFQKRPEYRNDDIMFAVSKSTAKTIDAWLNKYIGRTDMDQDQADTFKQQFRKDVDTLDDTTTQLAYTKWFCNGTIRMGQEDMPKVIKAVKVAKNHKVDPLQFSAPMDILNRWSKESKGQRINPDDVPTLRKVNWEFPMGITVYMVDESEESQQNMRQIINTHWGPDANPWCLLQGDGQGNLSDGRNSRYDARYYWKHYSAYPKMVAFQNGKLLSFCANDTEEHAWWDRQDQPHMDIPVTGVIPGDKLGRSATFGINDMSGEVETTTLEDIHLGDKQNGPYRVWYDLDHIREEYTTVDGKYIGTRKIWHTNGQLLRVIKYNDNGTFSDYVSYYADGNVEEHHIYDENGQALEITKYFANGDIRHKEEGDINHRHIREFFKDGSLMSETYDDQDGTKAMYIYDENGKLTESWEAVERPYGRRYNRYSLERRDDGGTKDKTETLIPSPLTGEKNYDIWKTVVNMFIKSPDERFNTDNKNVRYSIKGMTNPAYVEISNNGILLTQRYTDSRAENNRDVTYENSYSADGHLSRVDVEFYDELGNLYRRRYDLDKDTVTDRFYQAEDIDWGMAPARTHERPMEAEDRANMPDARAKWEAKYRELMGEDTPLLAATSSTVDRYEELNLRYRNAEAMRDYLISVKNMQQAIEEKTGKQLGDFENVYRAGIRLSSVNKAEFDEFEGGVYKRLKDEYGRLVREIGGDDAVTDLDKYLVAKHGLERNQVFAERDARAFADDHHGDKEGKYAGRDWQSIYDEALRRNLKRDYSGLTSLFGEEDLNTATGMASLLVEQFEQRHSTAELWKRIDAVADYSLYKSMATGIITRETYDKIHGMFKNYVPLRGFQEDIAEDTYEYFEKHSSSFSPAIKIARGRKSVADSPIATLGNMGLSTIMQCNRNDMKKMLLNLAERTRTGLLSVDEVMYCKDATGEWVPFLATYPADATAEQRADIDAQHRADFTANRLQDPDNWKTESDLVSIPHKVLGQKQLQEHQVLVVRDGVRRIVTINGDPRAAQAINGKLNPEANQGALTKLANSLNRTLAANFTTRNPAFVVSNLFRDGIYANSIVWVKEGAKYAGNYNRNWAECMAILPGLLHRFNQGTLDMDDPVDRMFSDFVKNGGETGYTVLKTVDDFKKEMKKQLKAEGRLGLVRGTADVLGAVADGLKNFNQWAELVSRFAAFKTSREAGRSILRSVDDAKEITVNFNKKGAGAKTAGNWEKGNRAHYIWASTSQVGRDLYVFWNAGVQGLANICEAAGKDGKSMAKAIALGSALFSMGAMIAALASGGGDGDDDEYGYYDLPEYVRRSNLCFNIGGQWIKIPLSIEYRALYGLGELAYSAISGKEYHDTDELAKKIVSQVSQILPLDFAGDGGGNLLPTTVQPIFQVMNNRSWTGAPIYRDSPYNENEPEWAKAYSNTGKTIVDFTKWMNEITGGDDHRKGWMDLNPAKIEHLAKGYFGGLYNFYVGDVSKTVNTILGNRDFEWRNTPVLDRLFIDSDPEARTRNMRSSYFDYLEKMDRIKDELDAYKRDIRKAENAEDKRKAMDKYLELMDKPEYRFYLDVWAPGKSRIDKARTKKMEDYEQTEMQKLVDRYREFRKANRRF